MRMHSYTCHYLQCNVLFLWKSYPLEHLPSGVQRLCLMLQQSRFTVDKIIANTLNGIFLYSQFPNSTSDFFVFVTGSKDHLDQVEDLLGLLVEDLAQDPQDRCDRTRGTNLLRLRGRPTELGHQARRDIQ